MFIFAPGSLHISVNCHNTVKHKTRQLLSLQIPTSFISSCSIFSGRKLPRNQVTIISPALSMGAIRGKNFSYITCLLWWIWQKFRLAWNKYCCIQSHNRISILRWFKISAAKREMPQFLGIFLFKMNTNCFILNKDDPNCTQVILLSKYTNQTLLSQLLLPRKYFFISHLFLLLLVHSLFLSLLSFWSAKSLSSKKLTFSLMF